MSVARRVHGGLPVPLLRHVGPDEHCRITDLPGDLCPGVHVHIGNDDVRALAGQHAGDGGAKAGAGAGDEEGLSVDQHARAPAARLRSAERCRCVMQSSQYRNPPTGRFAPSILPDCMSVGYCKR